MKFLSVCSGIEAASVAWGPLGWKAVAFAEIEKFPSAVLRHHYPDTPNHGDMTKFQEWPDHAIDILCGGTPCQSFSIAGLRQGMADPRGNLMLTFGAIADRYRPRWIVWENVPGVLSSNGGRDFATFLGLLGQLGYGWAYRVLDAQHVRTRRFGRAVPQRRRRVFVVGYLGDWRRAAAVLFDRESLSGHPAPRREAGQGPAPSAESGFDVGGTIGPRVSRLTTDECINGAAIVAHAVTCHQAKGGDPTTDNYVAHTLLGKEHSSHAADVDTYVAHALRAEGFDASEDGTGRGIPLVAATHKATHDRHRADVEQTLLPVAVFDPRQITNKDHRGGTRGDRCHSLHEHAPAIAFQSKASAHQSMNPSTVAPTLDVGKHDGLAVAFNAYQRTVSDIPGPLTAGDDRKLERGVLQNMAVRRLTPRECERLQGFPDDYTLVTNRGKPAADGPRYKALGNSMAVNCMRWIGRRIAAVEGL